MRALSLTPISPPGVTSIRRPPRRGRTHDEDDLVMPDHSGIPSFTHSFSMLIKRGCPLCFCGFTWILNPRVALVLLMGYGYVKSWGHTLICSSVGHGSFVLIPFFETAHTTFHHYLFMWHGMSSPLFFLGTPFIPPGDQCNRRSRPNEHVRSAVSGMRVVHWIPDIKLYLDTDGKLL